MIFLKLISAKCVVCPFSGVEFIEAELAHRGLSNMHVRCPVINGRIIIPKDAAFNAVAKCLNVRNKILFYKNEYAPTITKQLEHRDLSFTAPDNTYDIVNLVRKVLNSNIYTNKDLYEQLGVSAPTITNKKNGTELMLSEWIAIMALLKPYKNSDQNVAELFKLLSKFLGDIDD